MLFHPKFTIPLLAPCKTVMVLHGADWFIREQAQYYHRFDVAYMRRNQANGINSSKMKLKEVGKDHYELVEHYTNNNNEEVEVKHDIVRKPTNVEWTTYASTDGTWEKVRTMSLKKKN